MPEPKWKRVGVLPEDATPVAVSVSPDGHGVVATTTEPTEGSPEQQMRARKARLWRVTAEGVLPVYEGAGWIQAVDNHGACWFAVAATLRATGAGADYRLLRSADGGKTWEVPGAIPATSIAQVLAVSEHEAWVLGARHLAATLDGGTSWSPLSLNGERNPVLERLRRLDHGVALVGPGIAASTDSGRSFVQRGTPAPVYDLAGGMLIAQVEGAPRLGALGDREISWLARLPKDRMPTRLAVQGPVVRLLSRAADPARGIDLKLHRSEDGGKTLSDVSLGLTQHSNIAGLCGLGLDLQRQVFWA